MFTGALVASDKLAKGNVYTFKITTPLIGVYPLSSTIQGLLQQYLEGFATILNVDRSAFSSAYIVELSPLIEGYNSDYWRSTLKFTMEQAAADGWLTGLGGDVVVISVIGEPMSDYEEKVIEEGLPWWERLFKGIGGTAGTALSATTSAFFKSAFPIIIIGSGAYLAFKAVERKVIR